MTGRSLRAPRGPLFWGVAVAALALAGCGGQIRYEPSLTDSIRAWDTSRFDGYNVYYRGSPERPEAVVLDAADGPPFQGSGWSRAEQASASRLVRAAVNAGSEAAPLRDKGGDVLGYLLANTRKQERTQNLYALALGAGDGGYAVNQHQFQYSGSGAGAGAR